MALLAWPLAAFGGVYAWAAAPVVAGTGILASACRPRLAAGDRRWLDTALLAFLLGGVVQMAPLPLALRDAVLPRAAALSSALFLDAGTAGWQPISMDVRATASSLAVIVAAVLFFWSCREAFDRELPRPALRAVAWLGLAVSLLAIVQRAASPDAIYGWWPPQDPGHGSPFGPFVNRNHFATWVIMALPLSAGYLAARRLHRPPAPDTAGWRGRLTASLDTRTMWLAAAGGLMTLGLVASLSRSGLASLAAAAGFGLWLARGRLGGRGRLWAGAYVALLAFFVLVWANIPAVVDRVDQTWRSGTGGRTAIWRDTGVVVKSFWPAGTGLGSYERVMPVYQRTPRSSYYNHAHNMYLQLMAEGGLLLTAPAAAALVLFVLTVRRRLQADRSWRFWIRAGAACGLAAVAMQSLFEGGLRMPANALLCALLAAVAVSRAGAGAREPHGGAHRGEIG